MVRQAPRLKPRLGQGAPLKRRGPLIRYKRVASATPLGRAASSLAGAFPVSTAWEAEAGVLRQRAAEHGMLVAMANYGAPSGGLAAAGRSSIWDERGELVLQLEASGAGVGLAWGTGDGGWRPVVRMMSEGALGLEGVGVG